MARERECLCTSGCAAFLRRRGSNIANREDLKVAHRRSSGACRAGLEAEEIQAVARDSLARVGVAVLVSQWGEASRAVHAERGTVADALVEFLFGSRGALSHDGGALDLCTYFGASSVTPLVKPSIDLQSSRSSAAASTQSVKVWTGLMADVPRVPGHSDFSLASMASSGENVAAEPGAVPMDGEDRNKSFEMFLWCEARCLLSRISFAWSLEAALHVERLLRSAADIGARGYGNEVLNAVCNIWPNVVQLLQPLGRAEVFNNAHGSGFRATLDYDAIRAQYPSTSELERISHCTIEVLDETKLALAGVFEIRDNVMEVFVGIDNGTWVYLDRETRECLRRPSKTAGSDDSATVPVPSPLEGTNFQYVHVEGLKVQLKELGCASFTLPPFWLSFEHGPTDADTVDSLGHWWRWRVIDFGTLGHLFEALLRPFFDMPSYRVALCRSTEVHILAPCRGLGRMRVRTSYPMPRVFAIFRRFLRWWWSRQLAEVDELRLLANYFSACAADLMEQSAGPDSLHTSHLPGSDEQSIKSRSRSLEVAGNEPTKSRHDGESDGQSRGNYLSWALHVLPMRLRCCARRGDAGVRVRVARR